MSPSASPQLPRLVLVLACLLMTVLGGVGPAAAVDGFTLVSPAPDAVVDGPFTIVVDVDASDGELIETVEARLVGPTNRVYTLSADGPPDVDGRQRWSLQVDPIEPSPMANGRHRLTVRPVPAATDPPEFAGHLVDLLVPVRRQLVAAPTGEDPQQVALSWQPVDLPDFVAYRIERRPDAEDGRWRTVRTLQDPAVRDTADQVAEPGPYRYRLVVVRSDGDEGEVRGYSDARGVRADPADPGTFDPPAEPPPPSTGPTAAPSPAPDGSPPPSGEEVVVVDPTPQTQTAATPARPPVAPAPAAPPAPPRPTVVPLNDGVFEPLLPLSDTETEIAVIETEIAERPGRVRDGGTLATLSDPEPDQRGLLIAGASGLLLIVAAAHVRRFLSEGSRR